MGPYVAKIMVNFGDGPKPEPLAVKRVLEVTRNWVRGAVRDARGIRRKQYIEYRKARAQVR